MNVGPMRVGFLLVCAGISSLLLTGGARASTITVGSPLSSDFSMEVLNFAGPETVANVALPEPGALVGSPVEGRIVRWRMLDSMGGPFRLRVLTPNPDGTYTAVGTSAPQTVATTALESFPTSLPIKPGQTIGLDNTHAGAEEDVLAAASSVAAGFAVWNPALPDGSSRSPKIFTGSEGEEVLGAELAFNADVVPRPVVDLLGTTSGSLSGGSPVAIGGHDLSGATDVRFGGAAAGFTAVSDSLIDAVSPPGGAGAVDITVTTPGGTSAAVAADRFTYAAPPAATACVVPRLKGRKLEAARRALKRAGCKLGKVKGRGRVMSQSPKQGKVKAPGTKVNVTLAKPKH
jgi:hypothetical protein